MVLLLAGVARAAPVIVDFAPKLGPAGTTVTITGSGFTGTTAVSFNGAAASSMNVIADGELRAVVPPTATRGPIVVTAAGSSSSSVSLFNPLPSVTSMTPGGGPLNTSVTIAGANFIGTTAVQFNGAAAAFTVQSATGLVATVPAGATTGPITVTTPAGSGASATNFLPGPQIDSFSPSSGAPGAVVVVSGRNFSQATAVRFNLTNATAFTVDSDTQLTATVPTGATTGRISIVAMSPRGTGSSAANFTVLPPPPTVTGFTPTSGAANTQVTVAGTGYSSTSAVQFSSGTGFTGASTTYVSSTQLRAFVPAAATTGPVRVCTGTNCGPASPMPFIVAPLVQTFVPTSGAPGTVVTLTGRNFTGATSVAFGAVDATTFAVQSDTSLVATVPVDAVTGAITVTASGVMGTSSSNFLVFPSIADFTPKAGLPLTSVALTGRNFETVMAVQFNATSAAFTMTSSTQLSATVPPGATTGRVTIVHSMGTSSSASDFVVIQPPTITGFAPDSGRPGDTVVVTGNGLSGTTAVTFNGADAGAFTVTSDTGLTAVVPAQAITGPIGVVNPAGSILSPASFVVLPPDTGSPDAGAGDAGARVDGGGPSDAGGEDAGSSAFDAGLPDAGKGDGGSDADGGFFVDAGVSVRDAGATTDAGTAEPMPEPPHGCSCTASGAGTIAWALLCAMHSLARARARRRGRLIASG